MKQVRPYWGISAHSRMLTRTSGILLGLLFTFSAFAQGDQQVRAKADAFFKEKNFIEALPLYGQLVSNDPTDRNLNYHYGTCLIFSGDDKDKAVNHLKYAVEDPAIPPDAWFWLGRAYQLNYLFKEAQVAYQRYQGTGSKKELDGFSVAGLDAQCRNGQQLLSNLKQITVRNKLEVADDEFFRFYDISDIGGKIVVLPEELKSNFDKKSKERFLVYLPGNGGPIYFSSYGKDGRTGRDIYRTEVVGTGFATPVKLSGYINTDQDEDYAVPHSDGKSFYFSSKGHNSMGGYDIFRSAYDKGLDVFGPPENLDFAVNTPDDDVFYIVDPENKEACFASGRDSKQGKLHVYRVGTAQMPVVITVLKGLFINNIDPADRKAQIMVEDAVTRERVADVRTDINGSYVLSIPRSGEFKFLVQCGPSGKTHQGAVSIPRASGPRAYRQELDLGLTGNQEKLVIRNFFDSPLEEDMIALMMDEIRRRARLDITTDAPPAVAVVEPEPSSTDPLTQAGFSGDITEAKAIELARADAAEIEQLASDLDVQSKEAFGLAVAAVAEAERTAQEAEAVTRAVEKETDEEKKNSMMVGAAALRDRSRISTQRAKAALRTGQDLDSEAMAARQRATNAEKLTTDLQNAITAKQPKETLTHLTTLKQRLDTKGAANGNVTAADRMRNSVGEQDQGAQKLLRAATSQRGEENELMDRISREERELESTKNNSRKEELRNSIAKNKEQLGYLHEEVEAAFIKARDADRETALLRGQASLAAHLAGGASGLTATELNKDEVAGLGQRIAGNESLLSALPIDERFDAAVMTTAAAAEARAFNWDNTADLASATGAPANTRVQQRDGSGDANKTSTRTATVPEAGLEQGEVHDVTVPTIDRNTDQEATNTSGRSSEDPSKEIKAPVNEEGSTAVSKVAEENTPVAASTGKDEENVRTATSEPEARTEEVEGTTALAEPVKNELNGDTEEASAPTLTQAPNDEMQSFLLENKRAELVQALGAAKTGNQRDSLQVELEQVEEQVRNNTAANAPSADSGPTTGEPLSSEESSLYGVDMERVPLVFFEATKDETIVEMLYPGYEVDKKSLEALTDETERAEGLSGLELMLADSLRGEMVRQATILELGPEQGDRVLPKLERLRQMRQEHILNSERILGERESIAGERTRPLDEGREVRVEPTRVQYPLGEDPIKDRFVAVERDKEEVYTSKVEHRSRKLEDAVAFKMADLARMENLTAQIDSLEDGINELERKEFDKRRKSADKLIDEVLIIRTDLGQRSAYLMKEEWSTAMDSMKVLDKRVASLGLPPDEFLVLTARDLQEEAKERFSEADKLRKRADRIDNIFERDSLYRAAYTAELEALHELDKSLTVKNYLLGPDLVRGGTVDYETIARKVFGIPEPVLAGIPEATRPSKGATSEQGMQRTDGSATATAPGIARTQPVTSNVDGVNVVSNAVSSGTNEQEATRTAATPVPGTTANEGAAGSMTAATQPPATSTADTERARQQALAEVERTEANVPASARIPAQIFEDMLAEESKGLVSLDAGEDPELLSIKRTSTAERSAEMEKRSLEAADNATALEDSANATTRKRDKESLMALAVRAQANSDSLHDASLALAEEARGLELQRRDSEQSKKAQARLVKYYYLSPEEQNLVIADEDQSRYFQMRAKALEQYDGAAEAENAEKINRELGNTLQKQVTNTDIEVRAGRMTATEGAARNEVLMARASLFQSRADSLNNVASRLRGAAGINDGQAAVILQALPAERSQELMALEMRTRRSEVLLSEARDQAGRPAPITTSSTVAPRSAPVVPDTASTAAVIVTEPRTEDHTSLPAAPTGVAEPKPVASPVVRSTTNDAGTIGTRVIAPPFGTDRVTPVSARATVAAMSFPKELVEDIFELRPKGERNEVEIPMDATIPVGVVFKVQIGAFRNPVPEEVFSDMTPVMGERVGNNLVRYTAGLFMAFEQANNAKDKVRDRGYRDAFVVAYLDGKRIPLGQAMNMQQGSAIAANTSLATATGQPSTVANTVLEPAPSTTTTEPKPVSPATTTGNSQPTATSGTSRPPTVIQTPVVIPVTPSASTEADLLVNYPATAEEVVARFVPSPDAASYYNVPGAAPARQVETIRGLFFTVQVGVYSKPVALDKIFNISPLNSERTETAKVRYTTGVFTDTEVARQRKDETVQLGVKDAFVTAYLNGKRIPMREADALLKKFGTSILATP
jgi:hypothetical protein